MILEPRVKGLHSWVHTITERDITLTLLSRTRVHPMSRFNSRLETSLQIPTIGRFLLQLESLDRQDVQDHKVLREIPVEALHSWANTATCRVTIVTMWSRTRVHPTYALLQVQRVLPQQIQDLGQFLLKLEPLDRQATREPLAPRDLQDPQE